LKEREPEFLNRIAKHKGILYKVSKMYMDNHDDQQDLFQEIVCQLWKSYDSLETKVNFRPDVSCGYQYSNCIFKERERGKSINTK
jgi:DNA-directed RNA polymerase specialized sigma24 family protein